ncbi:hypothetical protein [Enhygromyxa salina]|uniref:Uncharacterized protein n=1 Tax=Enhygromyxa salina TaxID=215803 RepID=A0A2S9YRV7_9BACT|nr:hypothetical protein [Enhygromyxa salina]PRQ07799.1 hypothetical protein ENSA7_24710 [Enhygromyxa salina]
MRTGSQPQARGRVIARRVGLIAVAVALLLGPLSVRVWVDGRAQLQLAADAAAAGDVDAQILHLGRAARWRLPLATHDDHARAELRELAVTATDARDHDRALAAWRELRGALLGTRALGVVDAEQLAAANAAIVREMVRQAEAAVDPADSADPADPADQARWVAELDEDLAPRWRTLLASACFTAWLIACVGLFVLGIDPKGRLDPRPATRWGAAVLGLLIAWILLM